MEGYIIEKSRARVVLMGSRGSSIWGCRAACAFRGGRDLDRCIPGGVGASVGSAGRLYWSTLIDMISS